jgi:hypothetical protein
VTNILLIQEESKQKLQMMDQEKIPMQNRDSENLQMQDHMEIYHLTRKKMIKDLNLKLMKLNKIFKKNKKNKK